MDSPDPKAAAASKIIRVLRRSTKIVKMAPFLYLLFFALYMLLCPLLSDDILTVVDGVAYSSPMATAFLLLLSKVFNLCRWHVTACLIPSGAGVENIIDSFLVTLTQNEIMAINLTLGAAAVLFLVTAHRHFVYGRQATSH